MVNKRKIATREESEKYIDLLPYPQIKAMLADFIMEPVPEEVPKIVLTEEQFNEFFRIRQDSGEGRKGRPKKMKED